jgi:hypothetical protein
MLSQVHASAFLTMVVVGGLPKLLLAVESIAMATAASEFCAADAQTQHGPSLLQEIGNWRSVQRNLSINVDQQETIKDTSHDRETAGFAAMALGKKVSSLLPQDQFRLTHAVLLAVRHNTWSPQSKYLIVVLIIVVFVLAAGYIVYCLFVFIQSKQRDTSTKDDDKALNHKESSFSSSISESFFAMRGTRTEDPQRLPTKQEIGGDTLIMEKDLVNIVANAHYDVTRFPGHVVCITSDSSGDRHGFLEREIHVRTHTPLRWALSYLLAVAVTCLMPLLAVFGKTPTECAVIRAVSKIARPGQEAFNTLSEDEVWLCNAHKGKMGPVFIAVATSGGYVGPLICFIFAILLHISILAGAQRHWVLGLYTRALLWSFNQFSPFMGKILFNYVNKPEHSNLSSIFFAWKWMSYTPNMIMYWWTTTMLLFVIGAIAMHEVEWGGILILFVGRLYLPVIEQILGAKDRLRHVITSALQNTYFPIVDDENTPNALRAISLSSTG